MLSVLIPAFILGTLGGSFFYTLALRFIDGSLYEAPRAALFSRSRCDSCGKHLDAVSLIPVAGYLIRRGRCFSCKGTISPLYPVMEIIHGMLAAVLLWKFGLSLLPVFEFLFISVLLCISVVDYKTQFIPHSLIAVLLLLSVYPLSQPPQLNSHLYGLLLGALFYVVLFLFPGSLGGGDPLLAAVLCFHTGIDGAIVLVEAALIIGSVTGVAYGLITRRGLRIKIPFAPFLALGYVIARFFGQDIMLLYQNIFM